MQDEGAILEKLEGISKLIEDSFIFTAVQAGANKRSVARVLGVQNTRVSRVSKLIPRERNGKKK